MPELSDAFKAQFKEKEYPAAFLSRYEVIECLSATESGETLLVQEKGTCEYCVAKISERAGTGAENDMLCALSHPGLPRMLGQITEGNTHILLRAFVEGKPLNEAAAERRMAESEIVSICAQICDVLTYLHTRRPPVIHRDVKPQNVILSADGKVTLIDFGIARTYKPDAPRDTVFSGTSDFAPPEQYGFAQTDARADIYALGMLLKCLLTDGAADGEINNPRLGRIVRRCTAFAPERRYRDARALKRALLHADGKSARKALAVMAALAAFVIGVCVGRYVLPNTSPSVKAVVFAEPLLEQAARLALDKPTGSLTADDLSRVYALHIVGNAVCADDAAFGLAYDAWRASPQTAIQDGLNTLSDLALFSGLEQLQIVGGDYANVDALAHCGRLARLTLIDSANLTDIGGLWGLKWLESISLFDCGALRDLSPLASLPSLTVLDLNGEHMPYDASVLEALGDLDALLLYGNDAAYRYVHDKRVGTLRLSGMEMKDLTAIRTVTGLTELQLCCPGLISLEGIEAHEGLQKLDFWMLGAVDLSPLKALPNLTELVLPGDAQIDVSPLRDRPGLTIYTR